MQKYQLKPKAVEAVEYRHGKVDRGGMPLTEGDYIVNTGDGCPLVLSASVFEALFEPVKNKVTKKAAKKKATKK